MSSSTTNSPASRSWRDIRQGVGARTLSRAGRRRMVFASVKLGVFCLFALGCAWAALELYQTWESDPGRLKEPVPAVPLKQILFATDGVLDREWMDRNLALPKGTSLMSLNLAALENRLLASGQVEGVMLRRRFADNTLVVNVRERTPIARLMVQVGAGSPTLLLAARDGVVYTGSGYQRSTLEHLPWLDGVPLRRAAKGGFEPIENLALVASLLSAAEGLVPQLYPGWEVVSLARLANDREIIVRSREIPEIIFSAGDDYARQLAKLDYIVDSLRTHGAPPLERVNLALGGQVPVALQEAPRLAPTRTAVAPNLPPTRQRRDF
jgi:cell division protein FtsQ